MTTIGYTDSEREKKIVQFKTEIARNEEIRSRMIKANGEYPPRAQGLTASTMGRRPVLTGGPFTCSHNP